MVSANQSARASLGKAWALLNRSERRRAAGVLLIILIAAVSSAGMVGSVFPFLSVLADPSQIETVPLLAWLYEIGGFNSVYAFLVALGLASLTTIMIVNLIQIVRIRATSRFTLMLTHTLSHRLLAAYLNQPYEYFLNRQTGTMATRLLTEAARVSSGALAPAAEVISCVLTIVAIVVLLLWVNPMVALVAFCVLGGLYGATFLASRRLVASLGRIRADTNAARFRLANEALGGVKTLKLLGREASYVERYRTPSSQMAMTEARMALISAVPPLMMQIVAFGGMILIALLLLDPAGVEAGSALGGVVPTLGVFAFAGQRLLPELGKLYGAVSAITYGAAGVDAVYRDLVAEAGTVRDAKPAASPIVLKKTLSFDRVTYRYPGAEQAGVRNVSMSILAGERIGIVGATGAGKSTLADLLLGLLRPRSGQILVDGVALDDENRRAWQRSVGYVPQEIFLTDTSVAGNIAFGVPPEEIDHDRVVRAAEIAQIDTFVREQLPKGYATEIGERGVRLSGGQRQRVGIARALYNEASLIVFDEATSALDTLTESEVMAAIDALPGDTTVVMIAHRLSTVRRCDRILVLEAGHVAGFGTWDAVAESCPPFRRLLAVSEAA